jgi:hypothetical protein
MMHALPNGHVISGPPQHMIATAMTTQQMRPGMLLTQQPQAIHMQGAVPWASGADQVPGRSQSASLNGGDAPAGGAASGNGAKKEAQPSSPRGRAPSGWTPVASKKLPRSCFGPRNTNRRSAYVAHALSFFSCHFFVAPSVQDARSLFLL